MVLFVCVLASPLPLLGQGDGHEHWIGTWATASTARSHQPESSNTEPLLSFHGRTLRQIVRSTVGGERVRVVLTNRFGSESLVIGAAHLALRADEAAIEPSSARVLTFSERTTIAIPAGALVVSDPVDLDVPSFSDLAIDVYFPGDTDSPITPLTFHGRALQTSYVSAPGNHAGTPHLPVTKEVSSWFFLSRVDVTAPRDVGAVVAIGDSITDGSGSTPNNNQRWTDHLAQRLAEAEIDMGMMNVGIAANFLLRDVGGANVLARFDRDVLVRPGVTHVIVSSGINDIGSVDPPTASDVISAHRQLVARARTHRLTILAATITPFEGSTLLAWTPEVEARRQAVNEWIRSGEAYDGVIDFDVVLRDPKNPQRLRPDYASADKVHPNDAGYRAMAEAIDLNFFRSDSH